MTMKVNTIKKPKYLAKKVKFDGYTFDSKKEYLQYRAYKILKEKGKIKELEVHKKFNLLDSIYINQDHKIYSGKRRGSDDLLLQSKMFYKCDFFIVWYDDIIEVVDVKAIDKKTGKPRYIGKYPLKKKLMRYLYGIEITEV